MRLRFLGCGGWGTKVDRFAGGRAGRRASLFIGKVPSLLGQVVALYASQDMTWSLDGLRGCMSAS